MNFQDIIKYRALTMLSSICKIRGQEITIIVSPKNIIRNNPLTQ
jgi:hypothetical protein